MSDWTEKRMALPPDSRQEVQGVRIDRQLQDKRAGMPDDPSRHGKSFQRTVRSVHVRQEAGSRSRLNPTNRLYPRTPIRKKTTFE